MARDRLGTYRRKRDFVRTPEPAGAIPTADGPARRFVVQRHRASRLHYDFRLEIAGVLVSWAVPKGPTLDANVRRGAYRTEDHPIEYVDFEGVIPAREYGGGDVIVWDAGTWEPHEAGDPPNPSRALVRGELHVDLFGEKLRGRFVLIRTSPPEEEKQQWLLLHKHDDAAVDGWDAEDHPRSVLSGRTNDEIKADPDRLWRSDLPADEASIALKPGVAGSDEQAELDSFKISGTWHVFGRALRVSNLDREVFPGRGRARPLTKRDLLRYATQIAPTLVPYLSAGTLQLPKQVPVQAPDWLTHRQGRLVVDQPASLVWAVNFGAVEWRMSIGRKPTHAVIALDDATTPWEDVVALARLYRAALDHLGVLARPMVDGQRAIHVWIPIAAGPSLTRTRRWVEQLSSAVAAADPELGRHLPAHLGRSVLAPYSPRVASGAPVATPIEWDEFEDPTLRPDRWTIRTVLDRLAERDDLFRAVRGGAQRLPPLD